MRRALAVACLLALLGAHPADAKVIADDGCCSRTTTPGHALKQQTGVLIPTATAVPTAVPTEVQGGGLFWLTAAQVASYARAAGFPSWAIPQMVAYAYRESHFNAHAINLSRGACGLYQPYPCPGLSAPGPQIVSQTAYLT